MSIDTPELSIIIVNWNSTAYLLQCVESIYAHCRGVTYEIIVVDNCSPDGDVRIVKERFPDVMLIESTANLGFSRANNLGFRSSRGEFIVFLNPDTILLNSAFELTLQKARNLPSVGAVGCTLLNEDRTVQTSAIQTFPTILNQVLDVEVIRKRFPACPLWNIEPLLAGGTEPSSAEVISGACLMVRRDVFLQAGQFSEEYFMYAEDLDLCRKIAKAGFSNFYVPQGQIVHYGGKSSDPIRATVMRWKSDLMYMEKHRGHTYQLTFRCAIALVSLVRLCLLLLWMGASGKSRRPKARATLLNWWLVLKTMMTYWDRMPGTGTLMTERVKGH